jgi:hypothetical protein
MAELSMQTSAHVYRETELWFRSYRVEDRVTFHIGPNGGGVVLYLGRSDIERMSAVLDEARQSLQAPALKAAA